MCTSSLVTIILGQIQADPSMSGDGVNVIDFEL